VRPVSNIVLDDAGNAGRARRILKTMLFGKIADGVMSVENRLLQKQEQYLQ